MEIYSLKNYTLEVQDQTKNVFLKDDPCKEFPILPMGKVWSVDFLGIHVESHPSKKRESNSTGKKQHEHFLSITSTEPGVDVTHSDVKMKE